MCVQHPMEHCLLRDYFITGSHCLFFALSLSLSLCVYVTDNIKYFANSPRRWPYSALAPILDSKLKVSILRRPVRVRT